MKIKRFIAADMRSAMRMVREEQGPDAVILSSRRSGAGLEVVAATDYDAALMHQATQASSQPAAAAAPAPSESKRDQPAAEAQKAGGLLRQAGFDGQNGAADGGQADQGQCRIANALFDVHVSVSSIVGSVARCVARLR